MLSYHIETFGDVNGIVLKESDIPEPGPEDVLIKVKAVSLNRRDLYILKQTYPLPAKKNVIPISDGAGEIIAIGSKVSKFKVGDRVTGSYFHKWRSGNFDLEVIDQLGCTLDGMLSEFALLNENGLVKIPNHLSWQEAATLPCAALTAWSALISFPQITPSESVLIIGSGGVSIFAIQFAKLFGANVIALTSSEKKAEQLKSLGADYVLNYQTNPNWSISVLELTNGKGVNRVIETGGLDTLEQSVNSVRIGGQVILLSPSGTANRQPTSLSRVMVPTFVRLVTIKPIFVGNRIDLEMMNSAINYHKLRPVLDREFSFLEAKYAYKYFSNNNHFGKVIISGSTD